jgi:hypothetical protein
VLKTLLWIRTRSGVCQSPVLDHFAVQWNPDPEHKWKDSILILSLIVNKKSLVSSFKLQPSLPPSLTLISLLVFKGSRGLDLPHACVDKHLQSICSSCLVGASAAAAVKCMDICLSLVYIMLVCCFLLHHENGDFSILMQDMLLIRAVRAASHLQGLFFRHHQYPSIEASGLMDFFEGRVVC